jgi:hypothetical protein
LDWDILDLILTNLDGGCFTDLGRATTKVLNVAMFKEVDLTPPPRAETMERPIYKLRFIKRGA